MPSWVGTMTAISLGLVLCMPIMRLGLDSWPTPISLAAAQTSEERTPRTIRVGKEYPIKTITAAARLAQDGDAVEIAAADYVGDTAVWTQTKLEIRGINGRPRLIAAGQAVEGKGIWVIRGGDIVVENIEFTGARVPDRNGAGIRLDRGKVMIRRCVFTDNENGMLVGNDPSNTLEIEDSEFGDNGAGDGQSHNLYVGTIQRFVVQGSYFHHARLGHLLKTRAQVNLIKYNRLSDEPGGRASYELEFPFGGLAHVVGNLIEQSEKTENSTIVSFGAEGYKWPRNELYLSHNTIVNNRGIGGVFIRAYQGSAYVKAINNILVGKGDLDIRSRGQEVDENRRVDLSDFVLPGRFDFRPKKGSRAAGVAKDPGEAGGMSLRPTREYTYPVGTAPLPPTRSLIPGAFQNVAK
jgi:parallel beta helix pectate lyase-like protein